MFLAQRDAAFVLVVRLDLEPDETRRRALYWLRFIRACERAMPARRVRGCCWWAAARALQPLKLAKRLADFAIWWMS